MCIAPPVVNCAHPTAFSTARQGISQLAQSAAPDYQIASLWVLQNQILQATIGIIREQRGDLPRVKVGVSMNSMDGMIRHWRTFGA